MNSTIRALTIIALLTLSLASVQAENWPNWRGPNFNGSNTATNLPTQWSQTENIKWSMPMPGASAATPIIWDNKVFVSSTVKDSDDLLAICLDVNSGKVLWKNVATQRRGKDSRHNQASPSPTTDGKHVYFYYGNGDLVCYDMDGNKIWSRRLEDDFGTYAIQFGYGSSALLYKDKLYIPILQRHSKFDDSEKTRESFLVAIDPTTGEILWKHVRPSDGRRESTEAYITPIPFEHNGRTEIIIHGGDYTTGHDPETGKELWRFGSYNPRKIPTWRIVPSAVTGSGNVYVSAPKRSPLYAINGGANGAISLDQATWKFEANPTDVCTPLFYNNKLFVYDGDKHVLTCIEPASGKALWSGNLGGRIVYRASPTAGDNKIYCFSEAGLVVVIDASASEYTELARIEMGGRDSRASIAIANENLFIRTSEKLFCVGE